MSDKSFKNLKTKGKKYLDNKVDKEEKKINENNSKQIKGLVTNPGFEVLEEQLWFNFYKSVTDLVLLNDSDINGLLRTKGEIKKIFEILKTLEETVTGKPEPIKQKVKDLGAYHKRVSQSRGFVV